MVFFQRLEFDTTFLADDPSSWEVRDDFQEMLKTVNSLRLTNDFAERGVVALIQSYNKLLTRDEEGLQFVLQVVENHRQRFPNSLKRTLMRQSSIHPLLIGQSSV